VLELILNVLVALSLPHDAARVERLTTALSIDHDVPRHVSTQVMQWFGTIDGGKWVMDVAALVREVGLGILRNHQVRISTVLGAL
jgi:sister chromatid cohesion protein DCC1